ncbi:MAG: aminomethyl-transferring glycine dehydrogenase subunit GcvPA [Deltaproteobacteria bacterium]|nr:aminomethyl-transferring glycine dehydrogenase subunit GcvPA [Deltaproteobacteria bacterium]
MRYLPNTEQEMQEMLRRVGVPSVDSLFESIPVGSRLRHPLNLPPPLTEIDLRHHLRELSRRNAHGEEYASFLGAGCTSHYVPSVVGALIQRGEFLTAYTPYQPEVSQGTLQAIFEYQTMVSEILGMEIANASHYDGSTATAEAVLMALRLVNRPKVLVSSAVHPEYRELLKTYLKNQDAKPVEVPFTQEGGIDLDFLSSEIDSETACFVASTPNFFGVVEDLTPLAKKLHDAGALLITTSPEPLAFGIFKSPGEMGADIAVAEGQSFGNPLNFGGPSLGLFATRNDFVRNLPGRLVGETVDQEGQRGFVLTLATREQHIRRDRATSNICTNVALCALAATITLSLFGKKGFEQLALTNFRRTEELKRRLRGMKFEIPFSGTTFNEFVLNLRGNAKESLKKLREKKIFGGAPLECWYPQLENSLLVCLTETTSDEQVDRFLKALESL